ILKALEKNASDRFGTAKELADDLDRFLKDEPIRARRPSVMQRLAKWMRRHNTVVKTATAVAVVCLTVASLLLWRANQRTLHALPNDKEEERSTRQAVNEMYTQVAMKWLEQTPPMSELQRDFLQQALTYYQHLVEKGGTEPEACHEIARAYRNMGQIERGL